MGYRLRGLAFRLCPAFILVCGLLAGLTQAALARPARAAELGPLIPFEAERAALRGDHRLLRLNEDSSAIPARRIIDLPVINGRMGDHAKLDGGLLLYFPYGNIVSAETDFRQYRPDPANPTHWMRDPAFARVAEFDRVLGPICASTGNAAAAQSHAELRLHRPDHLISFVTEQRLAATAGAPANTLYRIISVTDVRELLDQPVAADLAYHCHALPISDFRRPQRTGR